MGFIASARLGFSDAVLARHGYTRVVATKIKGFPREIVIVDKKEFDALQESVRVDLFE